jgi:hypothetical protein
MILKTAWPVVALATAMTMALAQPAAAATATVTYYGQFTSGTDDGGVFGAVGADLTGKAFTAVYTLNDSVPTASVDHSQPEYDIFSNSGPASGAASPLTAVLTVGTTSVSLSHLLNGGDGQEHRYVYSDGSFSNLFVSVADETLTGDDDTGGQVQLYVDHNGPAFYASQDFDSPVDYTVQPGDTGAGSIDFFQYHDGDFVYSDFLLASVSRVVVAVADPTGGAVPEPASWALMIAGFGLAGAALRRRRAGAALA